MIEVVFETHSISEDNERGAASGWAPSCLSAQGRERARQLGERRREDSIAAVFSSDLRRAAETAEVACDVATRWALDHYLSGTALETLISGDFVWQEGWEYTLEGTASPSPS